MSKNDVEGRREPGRFKMDCLLCTPDTETRPRSEAPYSFNLHIFKERNFRAFLEKTKMKWKTKHSFLKKLKEESTLVVPEEELMCPPISLKRSCPLNQPREGIVQSSPLRGLCFVPSPATHLPCGSLKTPNVTSVQTKECQLYTRKEKRILSLP